MVGGAPCANWNTALPYTISPGSCKGNYSCADIAKGASGGYVIINSNACVANESCSFIGRDVQGELAVEIGSGACNGMYQVCNSIGKKGTNLSKIEIADNHCNSGNCSYCGQNSSHIGPLIPTDTCCFVDGDSFRYDGENTDVACNGSVEPSMIPSEIPSSLPSMIPSSIPSDLPSDLPSFTPSDFPSLVPSLSSFPSDFPSGAPSGK